MTEPPAALACRFCGAAMTRLACGPLTLDRCDHCGSLWFDGGELDTLLEGSESLPVHAPKGSAARSADALIVCPRCTGVTLEAVRSSNVLVHRCPSCHGVLVSRSAIEAIQATRRDSGGSIDFDIPSSGRSEGGGGGIDDGSAIGDVLNFIGDLLQPLD
jgi:Zn-finger nucleic acid-binding protein